MALLSDVKSVCVYFVGDRPRSWRWHDDDDKKGASTSGSPEEALDKLSVGSDHWGVQVRWDGEPELPG